MSVCQSIHTDDGKNQQEQIRHMLFLRKKKERTEYRNGIGRV